MFDERTPIHRDKDARGDYAQTLATGVFHLHRDRVDWTVHAGPADRAALSGTAAIAPVAQDGGLMEQTSVLGAGPVNSHSAKVCCAGLNSRSPSNCEWLLFEEQASV